MTSQQLANDMLAVWQQRRDLPPRLRLVETRSDFTTLHTETMAMLEALPGVRKLEETLS